MFRTPRQYFSTTNALSTSRKNAKTNKMQANHQNKRKLQNNATGRFSGKKGCGVSSGVYEDGGTLGQ